MKRLILAACAVAMLVMNSLQSSRAAGPFDGKTFQGRIAFSSDGNCNDEDDWGAFPVAIALLDAFGVSDRLVHVDYNNILPKNDPRFYREMNESVLGSSMRYGIPSSILFDCQKDLDGAIESIKSAINASSAEDPLYYVLAGPMEVPYRAIQASDPDKRKFVYCISHSVWNDGFPQPEKRYLHKNTKRDVIESGIHWVQVKPGSGLADSTRTSSTPEQWAMYHWMRDSKDALGWIFSRLEVEERCDVSDATMTYFLLTGDEDGSVAKLKAVLEKKRLPEPVQIRKEIRVEAEDFRHLENYVLEDVNDRSASHRLSVKQAKVGVGGAIRSTVDQPYAAKSGIFDIEVRYFDDRDGNSEFTLFVEGVAQGEPWSASADSGMWQSKTFENIPYILGKELSVKVRTHGQEMGKLDYVQFTYKGESLASVDAGAKASRQSGSNR